ncbi:hypothetical protein D3C72_2500570 [compost metagenome]
MPLSLLGRQKEPTLEQVRDNRPPSAGCTDTLRLLKQLTVSISLCKLVRRDHVVHEARLVVAAWRLGLPSFQGNAR